MNDAGRNIRFGVFTVAIIVTALFVYAGSKSGSSRFSATEEIIPSEGVALPVRWGDLGKRLIEAGVIDQTKFEALYAGDSKPALYAKKLLEAADNGELVMTRENSGVILNALWAFGLGNKNPVLGSGPMQDPKYGGAGRFASTGGWTLASGDAMSHYSKHEFVSLTPEQQALVERVAKNIYRPCCNNPAYFPDCNHGMAMLGFLELLASQGASEDQMYKTALAVNSYWFPDAYLAIARHLGGRGKIWNAVDPKDILGPDYSSHGGYAIILKSVKPAGDRSSTAC